MDIETLIYRLEDRKTGWRPYDLGVDETIRVVKEYFDEINRERVKCNIPFHDYNCRSCFGQCVHGIPHRYNCEVCDKE